MMSLIDVCSAALGRFQGMADYRQSSARIQLRRMRPGTVPGLAGVALAIQLGAKVDGSDDSVERLFTGLHLVALLAELNVKDAYLGQALQMAGVSELRLERLLRARPDQVPEQLRAVARHLLASGTRVRVLDLVWLLVGDDRESRLKIAQSYYRNAAKGASNG